MKTKATIIYQSDTQKLSDEHEALLRDTCSAVLDNEQIDTGCEVCISIVGSEIIKELNRDYRNIDEITDVLSFPLGENGEYDTNPESGLLMLGDIVINPDRARSQADSFGHPIEREYAYLTAHSMLHLLGYDHIDPEDKKIMRSKEKEIMKILDLEIETEDS